jgi:hypothetical protein
MPDSPRVWQRCDACGHRLPDDDASPVCPLCQGLLAIEHPTPDQSEVSLRTRFDARCCMTSPGAMRSGVWRFADIVHPSADAPVSYPEGNTPLLEREAVRRFAGCEGLLLKHEGMNPTGSFKDRGMTVGVTQAKRLGATAVACASTGNTSASLASYAALAGIPALVFVPCRPDRPGQAHPDTRLRRAHTARARRLRRLPVARARFEFQTRDLPAELDQSVATRGTEDDRARTAAAAALGVAGLDRAAGGEPREHLGLREGAARGEGVGVDLAHPAPAGGAGRGGVAVLPQLS